MNCQEILTVLQAYRDKMIELLELNHKKDLSITTSSEYTFITVTITQNNDPHTTIRFEVADNSSKAENIHSSDPDIKTKVESTTWPGLKTNNQIKLSLSSEIIQQIGAADNIASLAVNCTAGDNYYPGNFSKVILAPNHIELQQINYMNAKSLDHKNDYSLRSLVFRILLSGSSKMITEFTDRSSANKRHCGDNIKAALDWLPH